jgi:alpha-D-ribose 1-methylphosphonate 5-phosphate C-P lyase
MIIRCVDRNNIMSEVAKPDRKCAFTGRQVGYTRRSGQILLDQGVDGFVCSGSRH